MLKSRLSPEVSGQVPPQCQKCPMLLWFDLTVQYEIAEGKKEESKALELLDEADAVRAEGDGKSADELAFNGRLNGQFASWASNAEVGFKEIVELLVDNTDESCLGTKVAPISEGVVYLGDIVRGIKRYCRNPNFEVFQFTSVNANIPARMEEKWNPEA